jgi:uncharacterized membrane protein required for colicin V production
MGWVDIGIVAVLIGSAIFGWRRGLVQQGVELAGLLCGLLAALYLTGGLVANYAKPLAAYRITYPIVFLAIVGIALLVAQVVGRVAGEVMEVTLFGMFDQIGGALAGLVKGMVWLSICITIALHLQVTSGVDDQIRRSSLAGPLSRILPAAFEVVKSYAREAPLKEPFRTDRRVAQSS